MDNKILKVLNYIYILFIIGLILLNFYKFNLYNLIGIIFSAVIIYLIINKKINNKVFNILIIIGSLTRISLLFTNYYNLTGDYSFNYSSAVSLAKNIGFSNNYLALFPYLYSYIYLLGNIMKIIGTEKITIIILNFIFDGLGFIYFYKLIKIYSKENIKILSLIYLLNPFNIIWDSIASPLIIINSLFIIIIYYLNKLKDKINKKDIILLSIFVGIILSIFNSFRPIAIILIISIIMWIIVDYFKNKKIKDNILKLIIILITFISFNTLINNFISKSINEEVTKTKSGWSIYVGSNYKYNGVWNQEDSNYLLDMIDNIPSNDIQEILQAKGIKRYKDNGFKNIILFIKKAFILGNNFDSYTFSEFSNQISINNNLIKILINICLSIYLYFLLLSNLFIFIKRKVSVLPVSIYSFGLFVATLLVEVSPRYIYPVLIGLIINTIFMFKK